MYIHESKDANGNGDGNGNGENRDIKIAMMRTTEWVH